jgi:hypothetical protein
MEPKSLCIRGVLLCALTAISCGGDDINPLDPSKFSGMNVSKLQYDCQQTVQCGIQNGVDQAPDPVNSCIQATAQHLEDHPDEQAQYLMDFGRCQGLVVCDYLTCVKAQVAAGYGQQQMAAITYNCQQDVECRRQLGMLVSDPTTEVDSCIANNVGILNNFNPMQRTQFEADFMRCGQTLACDFTNCFPF